MYRHFMVHCTYIWGAFPKSRNGRPFRMSCSTQDMMKGWQQFFFG